MNRLVLLLALLLLWAWPVRAQANVELSHELLFVELQTGNEQSASQEFVEIYNPTFYPVDLKDWQLEYMPASASSWSRKAELSGVIAPRGRVLLANYQLDEHQLTMTGGFAATGGHVRLSRSEVVADMLSWGDALEPLGTAAPAPTKSQSLKRLVIEDGYFYLNDDNGQDWFISDQPTPEHNFWQSQTLAPEPKANQPAPSTTQNSSGLAAFKPTSSTAAAATDIDIQITEIFPDPATPQTDADDEFIELFNSHQTAVNLSGYRLQSGKDFKTSQTLDDITIEPGQYLALRSADFSISLSNSGGAVRLLSAAGRTVSEAAYDKAKSGLSWSLSGDSWSWQQPSPSAANGTATAVADSGSVAGSQTTSRSSSAITTSSSGRQFFDEPNKQEIEPINISVLVGVGSLAVLYAGYEYRHDIRNRFIQCRQYFRNWRANRPKSSRWRMHRFAERLRGWKNSFSSGSR